MLVNVAFRWDLLPRAMLRNTSPWLLIPGLLATVLGCRLAFIAGEALVSLVGLEGRLDRNQRILLIGEQRS